jgi:hypothetical protein
VGNDAIAVGNEEQHLHVPVVRRERPAVVKHNGLGIFRAPVLVEDGCAIFGRDCCIESSPFVSLSISEFAIDLGSVMAGNVVAASAAARPISMSRRVNLAIGPPPLVPDKISVFLAFIVVLAVRLPV